MPTEATARRLAFARYVLGLGVRQSYLPEPSSAVAILMFHDAAELLLQIACQEKNVGSSNMSFMDYFDRLAPVVSPAGLPWKEAMRRLNTARVGLKHSGTLPSRQDIEAFRADTQSFFADNMPLVFGVEVGALSLAELVTTEKARHALHEAEKKVQAGDLDDALGRIAVAFAHLLNNHQVSPRTRDHRVPSSVHRLGSGRDVTVSHFLEGIAESVTKLEAEVALLRHGIDSRRLARYRALAPIVAISMSGAESVRRTRHQEPTLEDVRYCMDFVIETALILQQASLL